MNSPMTAPWMSLAEADRLVADKDQHLASEPHTCRVDEGSVAAAINTAFAESLALVTGQHHASGTGTTREDNT